MGSWPGGGERGATAGRLSLARGSRCERKGANERHSCRPLECFARSEDGMRRGSCQGAHVCARRQSGRQALRRSFVRRPPSLTLVVGAALYRLPPISFPSDWTRWPASCCLSRLARMTPNEINGRVMAHWRRALEFTGSRGFFFFSFFRPSWFLLSPNAGFVATRSASSLNNAPDAPLSIRAHLCRPLRLAGHAPWTVPPASRCRRIRALQCGERDQYCSP